MSDIPSLRWGWVNVFIRRAKNEQNFVLAIAAGEEGKGNGLNKTKDVRVIEEVKQDVCSFLLVFKRAFREQPFMQSGWHRGGELSQGSIPLRRAIPAAPQQMLYSTARIVVRSVAVLLSFGKRGFLNKIYDRTPTESSEA